MDGQMDNWKDNLSDYVTVRAANQSWNGRTLIESVNGDVRNLASIHWEHQCLPTTKHWVQSGDWFHKTCSGESNKYKYKDKYSGLRPMSDCTFFVLWRGKNCSFDIEFCMQFNLFCLEHLMNYLHHHLVWLPCKLSILNIVTALSFHGKWMYYLLLKSQLCCTLAGIVL